MIDNWKKFNEKFETEEINHNPPHPNPHKRLSDDTNLRKVAKLALENMYMFGGMPKPDPKYDNYLENMIETIIQASKKKISK